MAKSIIGFHYSIGGNKNGIGNFMDKLNQNGIPFLMKGTDDAGLCFEGQTKGQIHGVNNRLIYRLSTAGQPDNVEYDVPDYTKHPALAAQEHFNKTAAKWPSELNKAIVWMEPINEPRAKLSEGDVQFQNMHPVDWLGSFMLEYAKIANAQGFKVCGPSFNSGEPEVFSTNDYELPGMIAYLQYCAANPEKAALSVHEYIWDRWTKPESWPDWYPILWGRVEAAIAAADKHGIPRTFHIFMTEWGFGHDNAPRWPYCDPFITAYNEWAARFPQVKGVAAWTLQAGWGDVDHDLQSWFSPLGDYAVSKNFDPGNQPAPTHALFGSTLPDTECKGKPRVQYNRTLILLPPTAADASWMTAAANGSISKRYTVSYSADDAGIGDLNVRQVIAVNPSHWSGDLQAFYEQYYPDVVYTPLTAATPAELETKLKSGQYSSKLLKLLEKVFQADVSHLTGGACRGTPREQYKRTYILLSPKVTMPDWMGAAARGSINKRYTVGYSADDAGIGDLVEREVIAVNPNDWGPGLEEFYETYYPGITYTVLTAATPAELEAKLSGAPAPSAGLDSPVALTGPTSGPVYPPYWVDVNPIGSFYTFGSQNQYKAYHTGADLNCGFPVPNSDYLAPTFAIGDGYVVHAGKLQGTWWNVVVTEHEQPSGIVVYARHSHLDSYSVKQGDYVFKGQKIGVIGDAGGQLSAHLHFDTSLSNILKTNPGHWPGENLTAVMQHYVEPRSVIRISRSGFINKTIYIKSSANFRAGPTTGYRVYKVLPTGTAVTALGLVDNYYLIRTAAAEYGFVSAGLTQETPPGGPAPSPGYEYKGPPVVLSPTLHAAGSDWEWASPAVQGLFNNLQMPVKWMSNGVSPNYWNQFNRPEFHLVRAFWKPDKAKTPQQAWVEDIASGVMAFYAKGARRFEILNEVNLAQEGAGMVWTEETLGDWLKALGLIILNACPQAKLYFPGMSPGVPWTNQFTWIDKAWPVFKPVASGFCLHAYTDITNNVTAAADNIVMQVREAQKHLDLQVPLVVSECSVNRAAPAAYKAMVYKAVESKLAAMPGIEAVCYYISSWALVPDDQDGHMEDWLRWGIGDAYNNLS